ncbi:dichlorophenol 6-monooxygenase [Diaporthe amygdali]|uniref:dichlorophenol 6-monooxygenase n=1 Tax=Phomopsis amygdali TaxID=1214568 RepID=UPI0022FE30F6|nr:dichlorophenol 6-monooxygenase [Diaporthe amygdali]KAJ0120455.1 dichlorophenol 6-monooxygenase [Diaporthe amygdali]
MSSTSAQMVHPVAIIGGGPVGLSASILLSLRKIPHILLERHTGTSIHPKACGINQRTTEIFRLMGIYDKLRESACPDDIKSRTAWYTSLGTDGDNSIDGREIWSRDAWGGGPDAKDYERHSPARYEILPQIRLEPLLVDRAKELSPESLEFGSEVTDLEERGSCVALKVLQRGTGVTKEVLARFVIAADGGRGVTDKLGIDWTGERDILEMVSVHFRARLRERHPDPRNFITWFSHPDAGGSIRTGYLYQIGPWPFNSPEAKASEEWVFARARAANDPGSFDRDAMLKRLKDTLKVGEIPMDIISLSHWNVQAISAKTYRKGRVFLAGDAAHKIPPWGALGMNTGIQDVQNLVWKLQMALKDEKKYNSLLSSYDTERRPVGERVGQSSLHNLRSHALIMDAALGMSPEKSTDENRTSIMAYFNSAHPNHAMKRQAVEDASKVLDLEFKAPGAEIGWFYRGVGGATDADHAPHLLEDGSLNSGVVIPSTVPGHNLPHVWIYRNGQKLAVRDLIPLDKFLLLVDNRPDWELLDSNLLHIQRVTSSGGVDGWAEPTQEWTRLLGGNEAVLVRPDGIFAWRGSWQSSLPHVWPGILERALYIIG